MTSAFSDSPYHSKLEPVTFILTNKLSSLLVTPASNLMNVLILLIIRVVGSIIGLSVTCSVVKLIGVIRDVLQRDGDVEGLGEQEGQVGGRRKRVRTSLIVSLRASFKVDDLHSRCPILGAQSTASNSTAQTPNGQSLMISAVLSANVTSENDSKTPSNCGT